MDSMIIVSSYKVSAACKKAIPNYQGKRERATHQSIREDWTKKIVNLKNLLYFSKHADENMCLGWEDFRMISEFIKE